MAKETQEENEENEEKDEKKMNVMIRRKAVPTPCYTKHLWDHYLPKEANSLKKRTSEVTSSDSEAIRNTIRPRSVF